MTAPLNFAVVLLAAGLSSRMGSRNKLLIEFDGEPLVRRLARVYLAAGGRVHVVTGHEAEQVRAALGGLPLTFINNPRYAEGQATSVHAGLQAVVGDCDAVLVALADQAGLTADDIRALLAAFAAGDRSRALIPYTHGQRGNPVVFPPVVALRMLAEAEGAIGRDFLATHPELAQRFDAPNDHFVRDIDTPGDLANFTKIKPAQ